MPKIADLVYEYTATTGTGPFTLAGARSSDFRTFAAAHSVGDTVYYSIRGGGQWEVGIGTLTASNVLTRTTVTNGSSGPGAAVNFAAGNKDIFESPHSGAYVGIDELPATTTFADTDKLVVLKADGSVASILASIVKAASTGSGGGTPPASDTTAPTAASAAVANATPTVVAITMSEAMDGAYVPAASAFTVGGHTVSSVAISGSTINLTVSAAFVNAEAARTVAYTQPGTNNARDLAGNLLASFTGLAITNNVASVATDANKYTDLTAYIFPNTGSFSGGTAPNQYFANGFNIYVKDANGNYPAEATIRFAWAKSNTVCPVAFTAGAWGTAVAYATNGGTTPGGNVPNSVQRSLYTNPSGFPGLVQPESTVFGGGSAGTYYLWILFADGSSKPFPTAVTVS